MKVKDVLHVVCLTAGALFTTWVGLTVFCGFSTPAEIIHVQVASGGTPAIFSKEGSKQ